MDELLKIKEEALSKIHDCSSLKELNDLRVLYLGKKRTYAISHEVNEGYVKGRTCFFWTGFK